MDGAIQPFLLGEGWIEVRDGDASCRAIFDRHYSRYRYADGRRPKLILGPGEKMLLLVDRVDEWMLSHLYEFEGKTLQSVAKGAVDLGKLLDEDEKKKADETAESLKPLLDKLKDALKDRAKDVRVTTRLVDSPACIVVEEGDMSGHLARLLKQAGQTAPESKPTLEINAEHALVKKLDGSSHFDDLAQVLFDQAVLAEGGHLEDPAAYVRRVNALLVG